MKDNTEALIIDSKPHGRGNKEFIARTLEAIKKTEGRETFGAFLRKTRVNQKENLFMKFKHLPTAAIVAISIGALLVLSGTAYAAYRLWLRPETSITSVQQKYGRSQVLVDIKNCSQEGKVQVEINGDKSGNPAEAAATLGAHCEIEAIQSWAMSEFGVDVSNVLFPYTVKTRSESAITLENSYGDARNFSLSKDTVIIVGGKIAQANILQEGDPLAFILAKDTQKPLAIIKLGYPPQLYDSTDIQNTYHTRHECYGNPKSSCIDLPSLDVLRDGEGGANPDTRGEARLIQGKLLSFTDSEFKLQSTSNEMYTVHTTRNVIDIFNANNPYGAVTIGVGDVLEVRYSQPSSENPNEIQSNQYHNVQLLLQGFDKKSDTNFQKYSY